MLSTVRPSNRAGRGRSGVANLCLVILGCVIGAYFLSSFLGRRLSDRTAQDQDEEESNPILKASFRFTKEGDRIQQVKAPDVDTVVAYVYNDSDPEYWENFLYFLQWGMGEGDGCKYLIVLSSSTNAEVMGALPRLPSNARYVFHESKCQMEIFGQLLGSGEIDVNRYTYFVFMDSTMRGPYVPAFLRVLHWTRMFVSGLGVRTKLVGPMISCEPLSPDSPLGPRGAKSLAWEDPPHVQSHLLVTDKVGVGLLQKDGGVFTCHGGDRDETRYSEMRAALAILNAGFRMDSLLLRYQGVNWADRQNWGCNSRLKLTGESWYDGISITPIETVFVPIDLVASTNQWSYVKTVRKYDQWLKAQANGSMDVVSNAWQSNPMPHKVQRIFYMNARGPGCFNFKFYVLKNPDLANITDVNELWEQFVSTGQFEGRLYRFYCENVRARDPSCFDYNLYSEKNADLKVFGDNKEVLFEHFVKRGQFEGRPFKFTCDDMVASEGQ